MRTTTPGIWAAGDVTATIQLTPIASEQAQVAVEDMLGEGTRTMDYSFLPTAIFTDPELASVGLTEPEAKGTGHEVGVAAIRRATSSARTTRPPGGDPARPPEARLRPGSRRVLGIHAAVRGGSELVQGYAVALRLGATVDDLALPTTPSPPTARRSTTPPRRSRSLAGRSLSV